MTAAMSCAMLEVLCGDRDSYFGHIPRDITRIIAELVRRDCVLNALASEQARDLGILYPRDYCEHLILGARREDKVIIDIISGEEWSAPGAVRLLSVSEYWTGGDTAHNIRTGATRLIPVIVDKKLDKPHIYLGRGYPFYADDSIYMQRGGGEWGCAAGMRELWIPRPTLPPKVARRSKISGRTERDIQYFQTSSDMVGVKVNGGESILVHVHESNFKCHALIEHPAGALAQIGITLYLYHNDHRYARARRTTICCEMPGRVLYVYKNNILLTNYSNPSLSIAMLTG